MTYQPSIPQASDIIATSQQDILDNFTQLNSIYGTLGDHYAWDNGTPSEQNRHAKVTLPRLPTANAPGNATPVPGAQDGVIYAKETVSQTIPYWRKDAGAVDFPLLPIRAMGRFTFAGADVGTPFNLTVSAGGGTLAQTLSFTEDMPDTNYLVLVQGYNSSTAGSRDNLVDDTSIAVGSFDILFANSANQYNQYAVVVFHYA